MLLAQMTDRELIWRTFLCEAWGPSPERARDLTELETVVLQRASAKTLFLQFKEAREQGAQAFSLAQHLSLIMRDHGEHAAREWSASQAGSLPSRVVTHLNREFQIQSSYRQAKNRPGNRTDPGSSVRTSLIDGQHPNALRRQKPAPFWEIYIDETGSVFDETAKELSETHKVGRIVAIAVPAGARLPPIHAFHAATSSPQEVDEVLQRVLDAPVGILGFSVQDETARHRYWIGHVLHLIRWTLLQLPVPTGGQRCRVEIFIEQRESYNKDTDLSVAARALESELSVVDPDRFAELALDLKFMAKDHPMDGYVDAVAFTWGSPAIASKARLQQSKLIGHCLVAADEIGLHHLYLALSRTGELAAPDWYALCSAVVSDPEGGFLGRELERLGKSMAERPGQWQSYLAEVQMRLQSKQYELLELGHAVVWLQTFAGHGQTLPGVLKLQLDSSNLALANHRGQIDKNLVIACLDGVQRLRDEASQMACEALLRMVSATTNSFEFHILEKVIADWLAEPVAVAGLANYGKLQSVRGQLLAFKGRPDEALPWFDKALASFERLSDFIQANREIRQTQVYRLIAWMDAARFQAGLDREAKVTQLMAALSQHFSDEEPSAISRSIAWTSQDDRFDHHLWLRAMVCFPTELAEARRVYLKEISNWKMGQDYPWALIQAYRAWLLFDAGRVGEARRSFEEAIEICLDAEQGTTLHWMAEVLLQLARALGTDIALDFTGPDNRDGLRSRLIQAPHDALSAFAQDARQAKMERDRILAYLEACLPFNFH